jgi:hypothetical protein
MPESITSSQIAVTPGSGIVLDATQVTVSSTNVDREVVVIGDPATGSQYAEVTPKGTQADNALGVQDLKDSGRSFLMLSVPNQTASSSTSAAAVSNITQNSNFTSTTGVTAFAIPSGKTLRIQNFSGSGACEGPVSTTTTTRVCLVVQIRVATTNTTTAIAAGVIVSQIDIPLMVATSVGDVGGHEVNKAFPDGLEIPYGNSAGNYVGVTYNVQGSGTITLILLGACVQGFTY